MENNQAKEKGGLLSAIEQALSKGTEKERMIAILSCVKGYRNDYNIETEKAQFDGFSKCRNEFKNQISKIQNCVEQHNF